MTMAEKYQLAIKVLRQERDVIAGIGNPMDDEQLQDLDRQIAGAQLALQLLAK